jgi:hypothetical protein
MPRRRSPSPPPEATPRADFGAQLRAGWRAYLSPVLQPDEQAFGPAPAEVDPWCGRRVGRHPGRLPQLMEGVLMEAVLEGADVEAVLAPPSVCVFACLAAKRRWLVAANPNTKHQTPNTHNQTAPASSPARRSARAGRRGRCAPGRA